MMRRVRRETVRPLFVDVRADQRVTSDPELTMPAGYADLLAQIKAEVLAGRARAARAVNSEVIELYWRIGQILLLQHDTAKPP